MKKNFSLKNKCPYCDPFDIPAGHWQEFLGKSFFLGKKIFIGLNNIVKKTSPSLYKSLNKIIIYTTFRGLLVIGLLKESPISENDHLIPNRTLVFIKAAEQKKMTVRSLKLFGRKSTTFLLLS